MQAVDHTRQTQTVTSLNRRYGEVTSSFLSDRWQYCSCCEEYLPLSEFWTFSVGPQYIDCQSCGALLATDVIFRTKWMFWSMLRLCTALISVFLFVIGFYQAWVEYQDIARAFMLGGAGALGGVLFGPIVACIIYFPAQIVVDLTRWIFGTKMDTPIPPQPVSEM